MLKAYPHVIVRPKVGANLFANPESFTERLKQIPEAQRVIPYLESEMIVQSPERTLGAVLWGLPQEELDRMKSSLDKGVLPDPNSDYPQVVLGAELAERIFSGPGESLQIISPLQTTGALGQMPKTRTFEVSGTYRSGHYTFDNEYLFLTLSDVQQLLGKRDQISGWQIWGKEIEEANSLKKKIAAEIPDSLEAISWEEFNSALFQSLKLEQYAMFAILSLALLIAVLGIVITLIMYVTQKRRNIGVLRALGASQDQVRKIFVWQGFFLGAIGLLLGAVLTTAFIVYIRYFSTFQLPDIYYDRSIPVEIRPLSLVAIYGITILFIFLATLYPSRRAASLDPIEAIRQ